MDIKLTKDQIRIREELKTQGWSLVNTTKYLLVKGRTIIKGSKILLGRSDRYRGRISSTSTMSKVPDKFIKYKRYIKNTVEKCLHDEEIKLCDIHFRHHKKESKHGQWHIDGGVIRVIGAVLGETTEFKPTLYSRRILQIPLGWSLIFTANRKPIKPTWHRMPSYTGSRKLIVSTFQRPIEQQNLFKIKLS